MTASRDCRHPPRVRPAAGGALREASAPSRTYAPRREQPGGAAAARARFDAPVRDRRLRAPPSARMRPRNGLEPVSPGRPRSAARSCCAPRVDRLRRRFIAERDTWVGILPSAYADGFRRDMTGTEVRVAGERRRVVGAVSMDATAVELDRELPAGTPVTIVGRGLPLGSNARWRARSTTRVRHRLLTAARRDASSRDLMSGKSERARRCSASAPRRSRHASTPCCSSAATSGRSTSGRGQERSRSPRAAVREVAPWSSTRRLAPRRARGRTSKRRARSSATASIFHSSARRSTSPGRFARWHHTRDRS